MKYFICCILFGFGILSASADTNKNYRLSSVEATFYAHGELITPVKIKLPNDSLASAETKRLITWSAKKTFLIGEDFSNTADGTTYVLSTFCDHPMQMVLNIVNNIGVDFPESHKQINAYLSPTGFLLHFYDANGNHSEFATDCRFH